MKSCTVPYQNKKTLPKVDNEKIKITFNYTDIRDLKNGIFVSIRRWN